MYSPPIQGLTSSNNLWFMHMILNVPIQFDRCQTIHILLFKLVNEPRNNHYVSFNIMLIFSYPVPSPPPPEYKTTVLDVGERQLQNKKPLGKIDTCV